MDKVLVDNVLTGRRVLVVEDEMMILITLEDMLGDLGCDCVTAAATVEQTLALMQTQSFDAAILDVNLDGDKSYAVADALAARGVPFVFSTGYSDSGVAEGYRDRPVLRKPYQFAEMADIFARLLAP